MSQDLTKFAGLTAEDLPALAEALTKLPGKSDREHQEAIRAFVLDLDKRECDWEFTIMLLVALQAEVDRLFDFDDCRPDDFLRKLALLEDLTPEGDAVRKQFGTLAGIAAEARRHTLGND